MSFTASLEQIVAENRNHLLGRAAHWERVSLADVGSLINGYPFPSRDFTVQKEGMPLIRIRDVVRGQTETYFKGKYQEDWIVKNGDLLVGMDGDFNSALWRGENGLLNQRVCKISSNARFYDHRFLAYCLPGYLSAINANTSSITVKHLSSLTISDIPLPLPPLAEQARIADALDELLSDFDAGVDTLQCVRNKLNLYRASILQAAVNGELTAEWRAQHPNTEPASLLLKRVLAERRRRWEAKQLRRFNEQSKEPPENWKSKYKEPIAPKSEGLEEQPKGWCWATLDQVLWQIRSGTGETSGKVLTDYPVLKSSAVRPGRIDFQELNFLDASQSRYQENFLERGDFLITRLSGSVEYVGCSAVVEDIPSSWIQYPDRIFCGKLVFEELGVYLTYCFQHARIRKCLENSAKSTAGHQRISMSDLYPLVIALPPRDELNVIVDIVEQQLSVITHIEADLDSRLKAAKSLRQSILRHAFEGNLVPQNPEDEPASELLKRIAIEREERAREAAAAKAAISKSKKSRKRV